MELADLNEREMFYKGHFGVTGTFAQKTKEISASHNYSYTDGLLVIDSTAGEVIITLPVMDQMEEREYRHIFPIMHVGGGNNVKIQCSGAETFANGATFFNLGKGLFCFDLYVINSANLSLYGLYTPLSIKASHTFNGTFDTGSFGSVAIAPLDTVKYNDQSEILLIQSLDDGIIASTATGAGGTSVIATDVAHGLTTGDVITIAGTTDYNAEFTVTVLTVDTFEFTDTWVSDQSGTWIRSARCTVLISGWYKLSYQLKITSTGGSAWTATGLIYKNGSLLADSTIDFGDLASVSRVVSLAPIDVELAAGDYIDLRVDNSGLTGALKTALLSVETTV